MIVTVTYGGKPFGSPMDDLREDDLLWFIKAQLEQGREVYITPESVMVGDSRALKETPPTQADPERKEEPNHGAETSKMCENCYFYKEDEYWCKAFGGFTHTWPDDTCSAWTKKED